MALPPNFPAPRTRAAYRWFADVVVRVRCAKCDRMLGDCYGSPLSGALLHRGRYGTRGLTGLWIDSQEAHYQGRAGPDAQLPPRTRWRCRCGGDYPVTRAKLAAAFAVAAAAPTTRGRVIRLPVDLPRG